MRLFVSYAREDKERALALAQGMRWMNHDVWMDDSITGGESWWHAILASIRQCDAVVAVISPRYVKSQASELERDYAQRLGKPLLPVLVDPVDTLLLPVDLAAVQLVDYTSDPSESAFRLAAALSRLPPAPPLPQPLPNEPPVPVSYLSDLARRVRATTLTLDEQLSLIDRLIVAMNRVDERDAAQLLLQELRGREDLYQLAATKIASAGVDGPVRAADIEDADVPVKGWTAAATMSRVTAARTDWRVEISLSEERHLIEYATGWVSNSITIDGGKVWTGFSTGGLAKLSFPLSDGARMRSLRLRGRWLTLLTPGEGGFLEFWVDEEKLLVLDLSYRKDS
jgi:TIR domain